MSEAAQGINKPAERDQSERPVYPSAPGRTARRAGLTEVSAASAARRFVRHLRWHILTFKYGGHEDGRENDGAP